MPRSGLTSASGRNSALSLATQASEEFAQANWRRNRALFRACCCQSCESAVPWLAARGGKEACQRACIAYVFLKPIYVDIGRIVDARERQLALMSCDPHRQGIDLQREQVERAGDIHANILAAWQMEGFPAARDSPHEAELCSMPAWNSSYCSRVVAL